MVGLGGVWMVWIRRGMVGWNGGLDSWHWGSGTGQHGRMGGLRRMGGWVGFEDG